MVHGGVGFYQDDINLEEVTSALPTQSPVRLSLTLGSWTPIKPLTSYGNSLVQGPAGGNPYGFNFPTINLGPYTKHGAATSTSGLSLQADEYGMDPNLKPQSAYIYNLGAERELPRNMVVGLLYAGSHGTNQLVESNLNTYAGEQLPTSTGPMNADFGKIKFIRNAGTSDYNALIATLRQTVGKLTYQASYTLGLSKSDPTANDTVSDQYDIHSQYAYTDSDVRQRFTFTQVYEVPTRFKSQLMKTALGGWAMNNTLIMQSGTPFSAQTPENVTSGFDFNNDGEGGDIPVYLGTKKNFSRSEARISAMSRGTQSMFPGAGNLIPTAGTCPVSQCSFAQPAANTEGGLRNEFRGPGYFSLDSGIGKKFELPWFSDQKASLAIRLQGSNVLNVTNFGNPGATFDQTAQFGVVSGTAQNRVFQFGGRLQF